MGLTSVVVSLALRLSPSSSSDLRYKHVNVGLARRSPAGRAGTSRDAVLHVPRRAAARPQHRRGDDALLDRQRRSLSSVPLRRPGASRHRRRGPARAAIRGVLPRHRGLARRHTRVRGPLRHRLRRVDLGSPHERGDGRGAVPLGRRQLLRSARRDGAARPDRSSRRRPSPLSANGRPELRFLAAPVRRRSRHCRSHDCAQRNDIHRRGDHARDVHVPCRDGHLDSTRAGSRVHRERHPQRSD